MFVGTLVLIFVGILIAAVAVDIVVTLICTVKLSKMKGHEAENDKREPSGPENA